MKTVNLRDFYQSIYDHDCLYEVPDEESQISKMSKIWCQATKTDLTPISKFREGKEK